MNQSRGIDALKICRFFPISGLHASVSIVLLLLPINCCKFSCGVHQLFITVSRFNRELVVVIHLSLRNTISERKSAFLRNTIVVCCELLAQVLLLLPGYKFYLRPFSKTHDLKAAVADIFTPGMTKKGENRCDM